MTTVDSDQILYLAKKNLILDSHHTQPQSKTGRFVLMSNPLIHSCDNYVVLEPGQEERILNTKETLHWLETWLDQLDSLPQDLQNQTTLNSAALRLLDTACDLEIHPGFTLQWFAVRLDHQEL